MGNKFMGIRDKDGNYMEGVLETKDGLYIGKFEYNKPQSGKFVSKLDKNICYEGEFAYGLLYGKGTYKTDNIYYSGDFKLGVFDGKDKMIYINHNIYETYEGNCHNNCAHGKGILIFKNNDIYKGDFVHKEQQANMIAMYNMANV